MRKNLILGLFLASFLAINAIATPVYIELETGQWSFESNIFSFEQELAIIYTEGADELLDMTVDLPDLIVNGSNVSATQNLNIFDAGELFLSSSVDSGIFMTGLRSDILYYYLDMTTPLSAGYEMLDVELVLATTGSRADTFTGSITMAQVPEPVTAAMLGFGLVLIVNHRR